MLNVDLKGRRVSGVFSGKPYTGVVIESVLEKTGYNHIVELDVPITLVYNNRTQTRANNRMVCHHVNYNVGCRPTHDDHKFNIEE
jgi:hypothetical protein